MGTTQTNAELTPSAKETNDETPQVQHRPMVGPLDVTETNTTP